MSPASHSDDIEQTQPQILLDRVRLPWLDVLRGVSISLVLCNHLALPKPVSDNQYYRCLYSLGLAGWVGVDVFFVLSGFLVSGILFRQFRQTGNIHPVQFLIRRGFKIYPAFWVMLGVTLATIAFRRESVSLQKILVEVLFLQNYFPGVWMHTWSLAVEEHCYLGLSLLLTLLCRSSPNRRNPFWSLPAIVGIAAVGALALRLINTQVEDPRHIFMNHVFPTHYRYDTFLCGVLVGYWFHFSNGDYFLGRCERFRWICLAGGIVCLSPVLFWNFTSDRIVWTFLFSSNALGGSLLLIWGLGTRSKPGKLLGCIATIGRHSYSIYLWHVLIGSYFLLWAFIKYKVPGHLWTFVPLYFAVSIGAGMLMSILVERPSLYLRERWCPSDRHFPDAAAKESPLCFNLTDVRSRAYQHESNS
jgi:peptidoglycan/LPS O-acetylase OafA/YrhL